MSNPNEHKRQEAINGLVRIAVIEGILLVAVVGVYLFTFEMKYLFGGLAGVFLISGPMFLRWFNDHGKVMSAAKPNSSESDDV